VSMIASVRSEFIGAHVTPEVKVALEERADLEGVSVSRYVYRLLKSTLEVEDNDMGDEATA